MGLRRRDVLSRITTLGLGVCATSTVGASAKHTTELLGTDPSVASTTGGQSSCVQGQSVSLTQSEARFLSKHATLRADLFEQFAQGFEDPDINRSDFSISDIAAFVFGSSADENPNNYQSIQKSESSLDDSFIGHVGLYSDLAFIAMDYSPVIGDLIELVQQLQWFSNVAHKSSLQQVFSQGIQCVKCDLDIHGLSDDAAAAARQTNKQLARRARQTAEAARAFQADPSPTTASRVADRLAAERRAGADIPMIRAWSMITPNAYMDAADGVEKPKAVRKLAEVNTLAIKEAREIQCFQLGILTSDEELALPSAIEAYNSNVDSLREQTPGFAFNQITNQTGNLFVTKPESDDVQTTTMFGFQLQYFTKPVS